jgi:hypothetical protein
MPFGLANTCGGYHGLGQTPFLAEMKHSMSQEPIRLGLITAAIGFEPGDNVRTQAHGDGLLPGPIKLADFGSAPIENRGASEKSMSSSLLAAMARMSRSLVSLLIGAPFVRLGGAS